MLAEEFRRTAAQTAFVLALILVFPMVYAVDTSFYGTGTAFGEYLLGGLAILWIVLVIYLAYNMFRREEDDGAVEYLLSLPISRSRLLAWKMVPRLTALFLLAALFKLLTGHYIVFPSFIGLAVFLLFTQTAGFILGIVGRKSWSARAVLMVMSISALVIDSLPPDVIWNSRGLPASPFYLAQLIILLLLLVLPFRKWDLKPPEYRESTFGKLAFLPMMAMAFPVVYLFSSS